MNDAADVTRRCWRRELEGWWVNYGDDGEAWWVHDEHGDEDLSAEERAEWELMAAARQQAGATGD